ncbi:serine protease [Mastigocoleus sp. MO_188.B34]|uniref:S1 family peptidase n=1 Tax=Mastigocoleus sp. MO_188.B34 TaxID=3036635 RepID=UPI00260AF8CD|nr:serine protease [Mastigocoleus sp. MO_188.B34]MDJ0693592.1 serine protease [Mastigocoleus sp. MO_188.B34]
MKWHLLLKLGIYPILILFTCLGVVSLAQSRQEILVDNCKNNHCQQSPIPLPSNQLTVVQIRHIADSITVKVLSKEFLGSGTLLKKSQGVYTVITNAHVLRAAKSPYRIQTPDGRIYQTTLIKTVKLDGNDLGLLQFRSPDTVYEVANLGDSSTLGVGDKVFVGGFTAKFPPKQPEQKEEKNSSWVFHIFSSSHLRRERGLVFTTGEVSLLLQKALKGGYQIGYTNDIRKGMSGAPLLNIYGEVVGINGLHKEHLWDAVDLYEDGTEPSKPLQEQITRSSLAVPVKTVFKQFPQLNGSQDLTKGEFTINFNTAKVDSQDNQVK